MWKSLADFGSESGQLQLVCPSVVCCEPAQHPVHTHCPPPGPPSGCWSSAWGLYCLASSVLFPRAARGATLSGTIPPPVFVPHAFFLVVVVTGIGASWLSAGPPLFPRLPWPSGTSCPCITAPAPPAGKGVLTLPRLWCPSY